MALVGWGLCEACLACGGLHNSEPDSKPPLHPNCDCTLGRVELPAALEARLREQFERSLRLVREMNLVAGDRDLTEREGELLALCRENLDDALRQTAEAGRGEQYHLDWNEWVLTDAERQSSRIKYRLSLEAAEKASGKVMQEKEYKDQALDKVEELHELLSEAAREFRANLRAVEAAFADEYGRRRWWFDPIQDRIPGVLKNKPRYNDFGKSNIDYFTAERLMKHYSVVIPEKMALEDYLCTDKGSARFTAAAIREAKDCLLDYVNRLPSVKRKIFEGLNTEERDALLVTFFKRGLEKETESLDEQLESLTRTGRKQRYLYIGEGYLAWHLWVIKDEANAER